MRCFSVSYNRVPSFFKFSFLLISFNLFQMHNIFLLLLPVLAAAEDYYQLLGVKKVKTFIFGHHLESLEYFLHLPAVVFVNKSV